MISTPERSTRHRARITNQGQITVPKAVRDELGLRPGDELEFESNPAGMVVRPRLRRSVLDFAGIAADSGVVWPATLEGIRDMLRALKDEDAAADEARIARGERSSQ